MVVGEGVYHPVAGGKLFGIGSVGIQIYHRIHRLYLRLRLLGRPTALIKWSTRQLRTETGAWEC